MNDAGGRRRLHDVQPLPSQIDAHLERVTPLQPRQRVGDLRHAGAEVGRRVQRRAELLVAGDEKVGSVFGTARSKECPAGSARRRRAAERRRRSGRRCAGCRRRAARSAAVRERALIARGKRHDVVSLRPERPGGRRRCRPAAGSPGSNSSWNASGGRRPDPVRREAMVDSDAELVLVDALVRRPAGSCWPSRRSSAADSAPAARAPRGRCARGNPIVRRTGCASSRRRRGVVVAGSKITGTRPPIGLGEDALPLQQRSAPWRSPAPDRLSLPLIVDEEERAVAADRPAERRRRTGCGGTAASRVGRTQRSCGRSALRGGRTRRALP